MGVSGVSSLIKGFRSSHLALDNLRKLLLAYIKAPETNVNLEQVSKDATSK